MLNNIDDTDNFCTPEKRNPFCKGLRIAGMVVFGVIGAVIFALIFGFFVMILWNWLMTELFSLSTITYWQAFGIVILARLIFGTIGRSNGHHKPGQTYDDPHSWHWKIPFHDGDKFWSKTGRRKWKYYHDYWRDQGKDAFEQYIEKRETEKDEK